MQTINYYLPKYLSLRNKDMGTVCPIIYLIQNVRLVTTVLFDLDFSPAPPPPKILTYMLSWDVRKLNDLVYKIGNSWHVTGITNLIEHNRK